MLQPRATDTAYSYDLRVFCDTVYCSDNPIRLTVDRKNSNSANTFIQMDKPKYKANDEGDNIFIVLHY